MRSRLQNSGFKAAAVFAAAALIVAIAACAASAATTATVKTGDSLYLIARRFGVTPMHCVPRTAVARLDLPSERLTIPTQEARQGRQVLPTRSDQATRCSSSRTASALP